MNTVENLANQLSCKPDTIVTILVTLTIFISGLLVNILASRIRVSSERRRYRKYFSSLIINILDYTTRQALEFELLVKQLDIKNPSNPTLSHITENSLHLVDKLPFDKVYESYFSGITFYKKTKREAFTTILNRTELIRRIDTNLLNDFKVLDEKFRIYEDSWNNNVNHIRSIFDCLRQKYFAKELDDPMSELVIDLNEIIKNWKSQKNNTSRYIVKTFILDKFDDSFYGKHKKLQVITELQNYWTDAIADYKNMENVYELYYNIFYKYKDKYEEYNKTIICKLKNLNNYLCR